MKIKKKKIKIYCDGADFKSMKYYYKKNYIDGFTTNPSLMNSSGISNYKIFAKKILKIIKNKSISLEVFSDDLLEMESQAFKIASWGSNIYVKIPITNTKGVSCLPLIKKLINNNIKVNITAVFTLKQVASIKKYVGKKSKVIISVFAGRIADTGVDPENIIKNSIKIYKKNKNVEILWASTREIINIFQAEKLGCQIITVPIGLLNKFKILGKNLNTYSLETIKGFYTDAKKANYKI